MKLFSRRPPAPSIVASPITSGLLGVWGEPGAAQALQNTGIAPVWADDMVAFGGAAFGLDRSETLVVVGNVLLDNRADLLRSLGLPDVSDHAILAELLRREGSPARALGMFAGAAWDRRQHTLTLFRDGLGARTIYRGTRGGTVWFGTRLASVRRVLDTPVAIEALRDYLCYAFVPGSRTMWQGIDEVRPGTTLTLPGDRSESFWEPQQFGWDPAETLDDHAHRLRPLLEQAVQDVLPAGEDVGVYLSGGVDSSLVTALAVRLSGRPVHTYAIHFGPQYANELSFSSLVADHCGTRHSILELPARLIADELATTLAALDDPIGDPLTVPNFLLGRHAARDVRVILNGEGGDPCFGGPKNGPMLLNELYPGEQRDLAYLRSYQKCVDDLPHLLRQEVRTALDSVPPPEALLAPYFAGARMPDYLNRLMHINVRLKGSDHILTKVSNLTTANGLLGRSPLFDQRLVDASFDIPPAFKLLGTEEKAALKRAVADLLPAQILTRPKSGMLVPVQRWFRNELKAMAGDLLLSPNAHIRPYLDQSLIRDWLSYRGDLYPRQGVKLWLVLTLEVWLRIHDVIR